MQAAATRASAKASAKTKKPPVRQTQDGSDIDPKASAKDKMVLATKAVGIGMKCSRSHDRLCYLTFDGKCRTYTHEFVHEHATLLVSLFIFS